MKALVTILAFVVVGSLAQADIIGPRERQASRVANARAGVVYDRLATTCGARFTGNEAEIAERILDRDDDQPRVDVAALLRDLGALRNCASVQRSGPYYICKKGTQFEYYSNAGRKLNSQPCDEVFVGGDQASCMRITGTGRNRTVSEVQSHRVTSTAMATCTSSGLLNKIPTPAPRRLSN